MFPARFPRLFRALDVALDFATLGELRLEEPVDAREEPAAGRPEASAAAELSPSSPPPFPPATAAGRQAVERLRLMEQLRAIKRAEEGGAPPPSAQPPRPPSCRGDRRRLTLGDSRPERRHRGGDVEPPEQPCLWSSP